MKDTCARLFQKIQEDTCRTIELVDGSATFRSDTWERADSHGGNGGGGTSKVMLRGAVFEQAGVNFSRVHGVMPADMAGKLLLPAVDAPFFATGISLVFHPRSPHIPTTHANFRYLEVAGKSWLGGGMDLTPYYLYPQDAEHFHRTLKLICDRHNAGYYTDFKRRCDEYFYLSHRREARGIGGVFFDYLGKEDPHVIPEVYRFIEDLGSHFLDAYTPIVAEHKDQLWTDAERNFQLVRRGRYVEFNLIHDRGTLFGLKTGGRTESILMSLPPEVRWEYDESSLIGERERELLNVLQEPREWVKS